MTGAQRVARVVMVLVVAFVARPAWAQPPHTVVVTVPAGVSFNVLDVSTTTNGAPNPSTVSFSNFQGFGNPERMKVSVKADASNFSGPGSTHPAATAASWTATAPTGTPSNGTLSSAAYVQVYLSVDKLKNSTTASVSLNWTLGSIAAAGLRSGNHTLTVRWKFEAF